MRKPDSDNTQLELDGMRYYYRAYPVGTLQVPGRQSRDFRRNPDFSAVRGREPMAPILFLNGAWQQMDSWVRHAEYANRLAPVILLDLPGNGCADGAPAHCGHDFFETAMLQALDAAGVSRVNLLGFSYGAALAFLLAQAQPERVERVALVGTTACVSGPGREAIRQAIGALQRRDEQAFVEAIMNGLLCARGYPIARRRLVDRAVRAALGDLAAEDFWKHEQNARRLLIHPPQSRGRRLDVPALVLTGEHDGFTAPDAGREVAQACSRAVFTTIREADHFSPFENPRAVMDLALNFYRDLPLDGVPGCGPIESFGCEFRDLPLDGVPGCGPIESFGCELPERPRQVA